MARLISEAEMVEQIDYDRLAEMIAEKITARAEPGQVVWGNAECAEYFKCSVKHFRDRIAKDHTFPAEIRGGRCKWFKADVVEWSRG